MPHCFLLEESPPMWAGPPGRNGLGEHGTRALVLLSQKVLYFQVFCLTTGAACQFSHKTEIVFLDVFAGIQWEVSKLQEAPATVVKLECSTVESPSKWCGLGQKARKRRCFIFSGHSTVSLSMRTDFRYSLPARMSSIYNFCLLVVTPSPHTGNLFLPNFFC